jgi:hypothetical protein
MPSIIRYQPVSDDYTTYHLLTPTPTSTDADEPRATILAQLDDGYVYASIPDNMQLPQQPTQITVAVVELTDELRDAITAASPHIDLINQRVRAAIGERYSLHDEIKLIRTAPSPEFSVYNAYVEDCRAWGRAEKAKLGL